MKAELSERSSLFLSSSSLLPAGFMTASAKYIMNVDTRLRGGGTTRIVTKEGAKSTPVSNPVSVGSLSMMKMMTPGSQNSRVWEFSHEALKLRRGPLGLQCRERREYIFDFFSF